MSFISIARNLGCKLGFNVNNLIFLYLFTVDLRMYRRLNVIHACVRV